MNMGHVMEQPNTDEHLLEEITSRENLFAAWKRVKENRGAPGIDGVTIEEFLYNSRGYGLVQVL